MSKFLSKKYHNNNQINLCNNNFNNNNNLCILNSQEFNKINNLTLKCHKYNNNLFLPRVCLILCQTNIHNNNICMGVILNNLSIQINNILKIYIINILNSIMVSLKCHMDNFMVINKLLRDNKICQHQ
jgi:hypothetical protein